MLIKYPLHLQRTKIKKFASWWLNTLFIGVRHYEIGRKKIMKHFDFFYFDVIWSFIFDVYTLLLDPDQTQSIVWFVWQRHTFFDRKIVNKHSHIAPLDRHTHTHNWHWYTGKNKAEIRYFPHDIDINLLVCGFSFALN